jgi:phosphohistidine phosphatase SixA
MHGVARRGSQRTHTRALTLAVALAVAVAPGAAADVDLDLGAEALWERLRRGGLVVLIRHAAAPGTYDPPGFRVEDCATQRNLSDAGREQARRLGQAVRGRGVHVGQVRSSRWCRARDTAALAFGPHQTWAELDSFVGADRREVDRRGARIREAIAAWSGPGTLVLVTHQFVISELTGRGAGEGELIVVEPRSSGFEVLGRIAPDP